MENLNQAIKAKAAPGVIEVIEWALLVHDDTMKTLSTEVVAASLGHDHLKVPRFTLYEREEARKILLEYGAGKPTRIVEHRGSKKQPIYFETEVVPTRPQLPEAEYITAEVVSTDETPHT